MLIQRDIIHLYKRDIAQYDLAKLHIEEIFNLIPAELSKTRFILKASEARFALRTASLALKRRGGTTV